jgi:hypothetical protein
MMQTDSFAMPPRRVRRVSLALAILLHMVGMAVLTNYLLGQFQQSSTSPEPLARSELLNQEIVDRLVAELANQPQPAGSASPSMATAIEPGAGVIESIAERIRHYDKTAQGPDPLETVRRNAALLERISNPAEVDRMASKLRDAMGAAPTEIESPTAETPAVDWNDAVQSGGRRIDVGDRIEIHETFVDTKGGAATMIHAKAPKPNSDEFVYTIAMIEKGRRDPPSACEKQDFETALQRIRPFEVIEQFPLLRELHRSAIVPIMQKMSQESSDDVPTSQPASEDDVDATLHDRRSH